MSEEPRVVMQRNSSHPNTHTKASIPLSNLYDTSHTALDCRIIIVTQSPILMEPRVLLEITRSKSDSETLTSQGLLSQKNLPIGSVSTVQSRIGKEMHNYEPLEISNFKILLKKLSAVVGESP